MRATQSIKGYAMLTIALSACVGTSVAAPVSAVEVRQISRSAESVSVRYSRVGRTQHVVVGASADWAHVASDGGMGMGLDVLQPPIQKFESFDDLFDAISPPESDEIVAQIRKQLGEVPPGEVATLQQLRLSAGLSQKQLAAILGTDQGYVSKLENGSIADPSLSRARGLAKALGVSLVIVDQAFEKVIESKRHV